MFTHQETAKHKLQLFPDEFKLIFKFQEGFKPPFNAQNR